MPLNLSSHTVHLNGPAFLKKLAPHPIHPYDQGHWGLLASNRRQPFFFFRAGQETPKIVVSNEFFRETSTQCNWTQRAPCDSVAKPPSLLHLQISTKPSVVTVQIGRPMYIYFVVAHWLYHPLSIYYICMHHNMCGSQLFASFLPFYCCSSIEVHIQSSGWIG